MTREEMQAEARHLSEEGLSQAAIAAQLGVHHTTVWRWLNPDRERVLRERATPRMREWQAKRDRSPEGRNRCESCGGWCGVGSRRNGARICRQCRQVQGEQGEQRIAQMWCDGASLAQIETALGYAPNSIGPRIAQMRKKGWVLPYRRPGWEPKHTGVRAA